MNANIEAGYIYVEEVKKYLKTHESSFFYSTLWSVPNYKNLYGKNFSIQHGELGSYKIFKKWLDNSFFSEADKKEAKELLRPYAMANFISYDFSLSKQEIDVSCLGGLANIEQEIENNWQKVQSYLKALESLEAILKKNKISWSTGIFEEKIFLDFEYRKDFKHFPSKEAIAEEFAKKKSKYVNSNFFTMKELVPQIGKKVLSNLEFINSMAHNLPHLYKSKEEDKASTDKLYVIYQTTKGNTGGFTNKKGAAGSLSEAEIFYDEHRAERSCRARGLNNYQIWEASMTFHKPLITHENFTESTVIASIQARQQKEFIEKSLETMEYKALEQKNKEYEEILRQHNLLPLNTTEKPKVKNKI